MSSGLQNFGNLGLASTPSTAGEVCGLWAEMHENDFGVWSSGFGSRVEGFRVRSYRLSFWLVARGFFEPPVFSPSPKPNRQMLSPAGPKSP